MWRGIKDLNRENDATDNGKAHDRNDNNKGDTHKSKEQITETKEQMRFIGLVLWHLVVRDSPIHDPENDEFVFIAKMMPDIDPIGQEWAQNLKRFDYHLHRLLDRPIGVLLPFVPLLRVHIEPNEFEIFQHLNANIGKQKAAAFGDKEKWEELNKKCVLLARNGNAALFFNHVYTPFLVFGKHTAPIILFIRALLEGLLDEAQIDQFLIEDDRWPIIEHLIENHNSYKRMLKQLVDVSKQLGYRRK
ncbi:hypothetical protein niasHT_014232 [Heterodera trifolii]|uniref:Uncharacterized protein n=1 Tax=Heterodera trifolii TaxID=157864 RepID=A0ABD2KY50_9BILA